MGLVLQLILHLLEVVKLVGCFRATLNLGVQKLLRCYCKFIYCFLHRFLVEVNETQMSFEVFEFLIYSTLLHFETFVVLQFHLSSLSLDFVD